MSDPQGSPIYSIYGDDEDLAELVELFVEELPPYADTIREAYENGEVDKLQVYSHRLKGSGGSYGFQELTDVAAVVEDVIRNQGSADELKTAIDALLDTCARVGIRPKVG